MPGLTIGGGVNWMDEVSQSGVTQDAVAITNLMAKYSFSDRVDVQLNVNNLFDEEYYNYISSNAQIQYGQPRFTQVRFNYSF